MPLVTLSLEAGHTREQKRQLADAVYEGLRGAIHIPENDRLVAVREHAVGDLLADQDTWAWRGAGIRFCGDHAATWTAGGEETGAVPRDCPANERDRPGVGRGPADRAA